MSDTEDFYFVERSEDQAVEVFMNLTNVTKMHWDGETMIVAFRDGENAYVTGEAGRKLRTAVSSRCVNQVPTGE
jgi:hypothetical protein